MSENKKDVIASSLGLDPLVPVKTTKTGKIMNENDYEYARQNLYDVIEKGSHALEDIMDIAKQSESPRAFEVVTNLIKTMVEANKDLLELAKKKKDLDKEELPTTNVTTNNNLNITSADLLKLIKNQKDAE